MQISTPETQKKNFDSRRDDGFIIQTLRSRTPFKVSDLRTFRCATIDAGAFETGSSAILSSHLLYLLSQFSSWGQHQTLGTDRYGNFNIYSPNGFQFC